MSSPTRVPQLVGLAGALWMSFPMATEAFGQGCCFWKSQPPAYPVGPAVPVNAAPPMGGAMNSYYGNFGPNPPSPGTFFPAGIPQTTAAILPTAAYDTQWLSTPVTYYRPVTQFDPNYGTTVTSLQPCTSYQYQAQRVPLMSPRSLSDFDYSASRFPAVTAPGYNPTALAPVAQTYPGFQQIPANGMPVNSNMPNYANAGSSMGAASTLPLAKMSSPATSFVPNGVPNGVSTAVFMGGPQPQFAPPPVSSATAWMPTNPVPTTSNWQNCPNGVCPPPATFPNTSIPSIPGATSVTPMGPPTYSTIPQNVASPVLAPASGNYQPIPSAAGQVPSAAGQVSPVLPPGFNNQDPESMRQPSLGTSAGMTASPSSAFGSTSGSTSGSNVAAMFPLKRVPVAELDGTPNSAVPTYANTPPLDKRNPFVEHSPSNASNLMTAPALLPPVSPNPIQAPSDFDAKPRWNPKLLPPSSVVTKETVA